jgi:hypothetical protein
MSVTFPLALASPPGGGSDSLFLTIEFKKLFPSCASPAPALLLLLGGVPSSIFHHDI